MQQNKTNNGLPFISSFFSLHTLDHHVPSPLPPPPPPLLAPTQIVGDLGASEWMPLSGGDSCFARGAVDTFNISGVDVNDLSHLAVRLVSVESVGRPGWVPGTVTFVNLDTLNF